ncbi:hypothetical protein SAMN05421810_106253 [Amycolatopsis arida]|uniref:Uncharacterized protein n=1 Tax=Amycolatopsis arida TaxID=587909 RepID=A0A1I5XTX6_9PSEU|nr:hypothetical protein [Amycolatopsis arida]TDX97266.1 hypothetical protein CLV69_102369 [Amycolatopsis arida]SFQ35433.1 hypothetical protein SAMN05421810_106253 [Amycolatopsis arida]
MNAVSADGPGIGALVVANTSATVRTTSRVWRQAEARLAPHLAISTKWLAVDPALVLAALRFYQSNAAARGELAAELGLARLRERRVG